MPGRVPNWTPEEDVLLRQCYPWHTHRWEGWETLLPGRTRRAIQARASRIGLRKVNAEWTEDMDAQLVKAVNIVCKRLHKGPESVAARIKSLRVMGMLDDWKNLD